ncbi:hypothetical protein Tco_1255181 [Tanacetum coccineum]
MNPALRTLIPFYGRFLVRGGFVTSVLLLPGRANAGLGLVSAHHILAASICLIGPEAHYDNMVLLDSGSATLPCSLCLPRSFVLPRPLHAWVDEAWLTWYISCDLSQIAFDVFCEKFHIPEVVHPVLPDRDSTMHERPARKIGLYTRFFDFANFRLPLSTFLVDILRYFRINISQLSVIGAAKNDHFFWVDEFACPARFLWHTAKNVTRDPALKATDFSAQDYAILVDHPSPFWNFPEEFLCLVGLSRHYTLDEEAYPSFMDRDGEIESLRAQLLLKEAEAAEAIRLRAEVSGFTATEKSLWDEVNALNGRNLILEKERDALDVKVTDLETVIVDKEHELSDSNAQLTCIKSHNDNLANQVHELETSFAGLQEKVTTYANCMEQLGKFQDERMKIVSDKLEKLDTDLVEMAFHLEEKFYPHLLTVIIARRWLLTHGMELATVKCLHSPEYLSALGEAISKAIEKGMQDGLAAGITHGQEGRVLTDVAAYNPSAEADYISALQQLQSVNFSLLAELKSNKDASVETIMKILRLEESLAERLGLTGSQPHVDQLMVPIHHSPDQHVVGASALSLSLDVSSSRVRRIKENIAHHRSALRDVFVPLSEPLSITALTGTEGTSEVMPVTTAITTALSVTSASASLIYPISTDDYEVAPAAGQEGVGADANPFPDVDDAELNIQ